MPDNKTKHQIKRASKEIEEPYIEVACRLFEDYMLRRDYSPKTAHDYTRDLHHREIEQFMLKNFGCRSVYWLTDDDDLLLLLENFRSRGINISMDGRVKNATMRYREFLNEGNHRDEMQTLALSIEREQDFKKYLMARGIKDHAIHNYVSILKSSRITDTMLKSFGCPTVFGLNNPQNVRQAMVVFSSTSVNNHNQFRSACNKYCDWIIDSEGGYEEDSERRMEEDAREIEIGQFEEMCDIAMHQNLMDAYNYHVLECMKSNGTRILNLNKAKGREYWEEYQKNAIAQMCSEEYKALADHFMEFFRVDDRFYSDKIVRAIVQYAPGEKGWKYWQLLARWKMAERVATIGYEFSLDSWYEKLDVQFNEREVREMSNIECDLSLYTTEERKKCAEKVKTQIFSAGKKEDPKNSSTTQKITKILVDLFGEEDMVTSSKERETTGTLKGMAMTDLFASSDYNALTDEIATLKKVLEKVAKERDEAKDEAMTLKSKLEEKEQESKNYVEVDHAELVGEAFCEIAQRYMSSKRRKSESQRKEVRLTLNDIMNELKLDAFVPKELRVCINTFDDEKTPEIPNIVKIGTIIMEQKNGTYIEKVMKGATGAINNNQK